MKLITKLNLGTLITLAFIFVAGNTYAQTKGNGKVISQERNTSDFSEIKLTCSADLYISQGSTSVTVKTDENLQELIETKVENGTLVIGTNGRGFRSVTKLEVHISLQELSMLKNSGSGDIKFVDVFKTEDLYVGISGSGDLDADIDVRNLELKVNGSGDTDLSGVRGTFKVSNSGSGDLEAENLKLENCYVKNTGSGDLEFSGKTNEITIVVAGSGDLDAYNLTAVTAKVTNSGSSDITLNVVEKLQVTLNGSGDLTYRGNPEKVDVRSNGSGDVYKR